MKRTALGWVRRGLAGVGAVFSLALALFVLDAWPGFGHRAEGARLARMRQSPQWKNGHFENPEPIVNDNLRVLSGMLEASSHGEPDGKMPVEPVDPHRFETPPVSGLRVTWFGHSSLLVEIDGHRVLTDPAWSERASPVTWAGPHRWYPPLLALQDLPKVDAVVVSHDHYDHLDRGTMIAMKDWDTIFIVPLGVGAHLAYWGIAETKIHEVDWWESTQIGDLEIVCAPARHASGRTPFDRDATLWAGYAFIGPKHRAFFSGDTGLFPAMQTIGERLGPFDVTLLETGQYHGAWPDWHMGPEQAVTAHRMLRGRLLFPMHWGLLRLAYHGWTEPVERVLDAAQRGAVPIVTPRPGQSVEPEAPPAQDHWWPSVPWEHAEQSPIVSSRVPNASAFTTPTQAVPSSL